MVRRSYKKTCTATCGAALACILVLSFGLHTIKQEHTHYGSVHQAEHEENSVANLSEFAHGTEKKSFLVLLMSILSSGSLYVLAGGASVLLQLLHNPLRLGHFFQKRSTYRRFSYLCLLFSRGILNPKYF